MTLFLIRVSKEPQPLIPQAHVPVPADHFFFPAIGFAGPLRVRALV